MGILIMEIISVISFMFSILLILFNKINISEIYIIFLYFTVITFIYSLLYKKSKLSMLILLFLPIPLVYFKSNNAVYLIVVSSFILLIYGVKYLGKGDSYNFSLKLKGSYFLYVIIVIIGIMNLKFRFVIYKSIPFIILHLASMILLIRSLRNIENGLSTMKNKKQSYAYFLVVVIFSVLGSLPLLRTTLLNIFRKSYGFLTNIILRLGYFVVTFIANIFFGFFGLFIKNEGYKENIDILLENIAQSNPSTFEEEYVNTARNISPILNIFLGIMVISLLVYIIIKIIKIKGERKIEGLEYTEKREFIKVKKHKSKKIKDLYIYKNNREKVRHHYKKYLKSLKKQQININRSDTSLDILNKAENNKINDKYIRDLYIKSRYSNKDIDSKDIESIKKYLNE